MEFKIFSHFESSGALDNLNSLQLEKFKYACKKAVIENPDLHFNDLCIAAKIYLNFIREFPALDLGGLNKPQETD